MSEEQQDFKEIISLAEEAQKRGKFNLADAIKGRSYPEKTITIFTDAKAAFELKELNDAMNDFDYTEPIEEYEALEKKAQELAKTISDSKLIFKMRGISQEKVQEITSKLEPEGEDVSGHEYTRNFTATLVVSNIVSVENAAGEVDEREFTLEDGIALYQMLPAEGWATLVQTMEQLTLATGVFKGITDAGFLQKS
jgi:hypothetical protein